MNKKLLTTKEVARLLNRTRQRIVQLIHDDQLPAEKIGRDYLIKASDLDGFELKKSSGRPRNVKI